MTILFILNFTLLALLVGMGVYVYHRFHLPLGQLTRDIKDVRYGRSDRVLADGRGDVLGQLAHEYNLLLHALQNTQDQIHTTKAGCETQVFQRTERFRKDINHLQKVAQTDPLTDLANRAFFDQYVEFVFSQSRKCGSGLACLIIDVDNFKAVNDTLGHEMGDQVLRFIGELLRGCLREHDFAARLGGDEFVVLLPHCPDKQARKIAERIRTLFAREAWRFQPKPANEPVNPDMSVPSPRLSIGMASMRNLPRNASELIRLADQSLYRAKQSGKNRVAVC